MHYALSILSVFLTLALSAQTWDNGGSGNAWNTAQNWSPNAIPANNGSANLTFDGGWFGSTNSFVDQSWDVNALFFNGLLSSHTLSGSTLTVQTGFQVNGFFNSVTMTNDLSLSSQIFAQVNGVNSLFLEGDIGGSGGITKRGSGSLTLSGSNSYTGTTVLNGGTLLLGDDDVLADSSGLRLLGGRFETQGFDDTLGTLTLSANSTIDMSGGNSILQFSSASYSGGSLTIENWDGSVSGGNDQILFAGNVSQAFLDNVYWSDINVWGGRIDGNQIVPVGNQIVPVPEPRIYVMAFGLGGLVLWHLRRTRRKMTDTQ